MQPLAYQHLARPQASYQSQLVNPQMSYQPIQVYYNMMVPGIAPGYQQPPVMITQGMGGMSHPHQQQELKHQIGPMESLMESDQEEQIQSQYPKISLSDLQHRLVIVSELLQITQEEARALLSNNICICCRRGLDEKNQKVRHSETFIEKGKSFSLSSTQISAQSQKDLTQQNLPLTYQSLQNYSDQKADKERKISSSQGESDIRKEQIFRMKGKVKRESKQLKQSNFENLSSSEEESIDIEEIAIDCEKVQEDSDFRLQSDIRQVTNQSYLKVCNNATRFSQSMPKEESTEMTQTQLQPVVTQIQQPNNQKLAQYAIIKKSISKSSKDIHKPKGAMIISQIASSKEGSKQQAMPQESQVLTTSLSLQKPSTLASSTSNQRQSTSYQINDATQKSSPLMIQKNSEESYSSRQKKEYQNDSNYTKNLLKGFRRVVIKNYGQNAEFINDFKQYFDGFSLNNEFILKLFSDSPYSVYFCEFLQTDPSWWMKEARIKDTDNQLEFFEICKRRQFSLIRTKRKKFIRPKLV